VFACHALRGRGGEHPTVSWPTAHSLEALLLSYAPPKNRKKQWPTEAQMEGWFPRSCGEHNCNESRSDCIALELTPQNREAHTHSADARADARAQCLNSRRPSQNGSRRPDRRICGEWEDLSCAPTLWKETVFRFCLGRLPVQSLLLYFVASFSALSSTEMTGSLRLRSGLLLPL